MEFIERKGCFVLGVIVTLGGLGVFLYAFLYAPLYGFITAGALLVQKLFLILPVLAGMIFIIAGIRERYRRRVIMVLEGIAFLVYLLLLVETLFGGFRWSPEVRTPWRMYFQYNTNFIPFHTIREYIRTFSDHHINVDIALENLLGNLILFMPMAVLLPCMFSRMYQFRILVPFLAGIIIAAEVFQLVFQAGSLDVDDFILNFSGGLLAFGVIHIPWVRRLLQRLSVLHIEKRRN